MRDSLALFTPSYTLGEPSTSLVRAARLLDILTQKERFHRSKVGQRLPTRPNIPSCSRRITLVPIELGITHYLELPFLYILNELSHCYRTGVSLYDGPVMEAHSPHTVLHFHPTKTKLEVFLESPCLCPAIDIPPYTILPTLDWDLKHVGETLQFIPEGLYFDWDGLPVILISQVC
jgi:hypothetical protein